MGLLGWRFAGPTLSVIDAEN